MHVARHAGEDVTISYMGADQLLPLTRRRAALKDSFGFDCGCPRCAAEEALGGNAAATINAVLQVGGNIRRQVEQAP